MPHEALKQAPIRVRAALTVAPRRRRRRSCCCSTGRRPALAASPPSAAAATATVTAMSDSPSSTARTLMPHVSHAGFTTAVSTSAPLLPLLLKLRMLYTLARPRHLSPEPLQPATPCPPPPEPLLPPSPVLQL
ncbi:hypothetical protein CVT26_013961 [Gymnopilus dilepis]|uniref:Uncharacterized protein n=1 Tax=Gymnopilus dilepis TaxID=231916 RepID=A0A409WDS8_9AGAR|nr:hypothetical protein CVT26_013961 [Gymnopilus dilepis]